MKTTKLVFGILIITAAFVMNGHSQIYQLSTPISGSLTLIATNNSGSAGGSGSMTVNFNTLTETVYVDLGANTFRQVGSISYTLSPTNIQFTDTQSNVSGNVTVNLAPSISFDTGPVDLQEATNNSYPPPPIIYYFNLNMFSVIPSIPVSGSYLFVSGGETNFGSFSCLFQKIVPNDDGLSPYWGFTAPNYPYSLQMAEFGHDNPYGASFDGGGIVADVTATNGFMMQLGVITPSYPVTVSWSAPDVIATNVSGIPASITNQPQSIIVNAYDTALFNVGASGVLPISYQWSLNGTNIAGATSSALTIFPVVPTNLGNYAVIVANSYGTNTSSNATLSMYPYIAAPFTGLVADWGKNAVLSVGAWGTGPLTYQWFDNGTAILNATNQTLEFSDIQFTNAGLYSVVVSSPFGSVTNTPEQVVVNPAGTSLGLYPGITISGVAGFSYIIQRTANLSQTNSWVTVDTLTLTQPIQLWVDTNINSTLPGNSQQFYRILPGP